MFTQLSKFLILQLFTDISIDGNTAIAFTENVEQRFLSYGWHVLHVDDGDKYVSPASNHMPSNVSELS